MCFLSQLNGLEIFIYILTLHQGLLFILCGGIGSGHLQRGAKIMRLIKCRKCGTTISTDETFIQRMLDDINILAEKARKDRKNSNSYLQQASSIKKIMQQYLHRTAQMDEAHRRLLHEHKVLVHYILDNGIVSQEKLNELDDIARKAYAERQREEQEVIYRLYGDFENITINRTKADPTAKMVERKIK